MTLPQTGPEPSVMVGSVCESTQHVDMPGIRTVTRSRALRVRPWAAGAAGVIVLSDGYWGGIFRELVVSLLDAG